MYSYILLYFNCVQNSSRWAWSDVLSAIGLAAPWLAARQIQRVLHHVESRTCRRHLWQQHDIRQWWRVAAQWRHHARLAANTCKTSLTLYFFGFKSKLCLLQELVGLSSTTSPEKRFSIRFEMLPTYLPPRLAEKILFVGESVQVFCSRKKTDFFTSQGQ